MDFRVARTFTDSRCAFQIVVSELNFHEDFALQNRVITI